MKKMGLIGVSLLLVCAMAVNLAGCATQAKEEDLMAGITPNSVNAAEDLSAENARVMDFAIRLFQASEERAKNTLISPLSVLCALAMTANGARGETLEQMRSVLGMTAEELNLYLYSYRKNLPQGGKYRLSLANAIWLNEDPRFTVNQDFLQTNADYYGAAIYQAPFQDQTCKAINDWVKEHTEGMIPEVLNEIPHDAVMYLVNALAFEAEWAEVYKEAQVQGGMFTREDGTKQDVEFMFDEERVYLEDERATGFMKYYDGAHYAFVAMLPKEGVSVSEYVASLDGAAFHALLENPEHVTVQTAIPKFETEYGVEMSEILMKMGMPRAFDSDGAEFEDLGTSTDGNISISRVLHKTFLSVGEKGTKASAATTVEMAYNAAMVEEGEIKEVYLNRPFIYMLVDCENNVPLFIGTMLDAA